MARDIDLYWLTGSYDALCGHGLERAEPLRLVRLESEAVCVSKLFRRGRPCRGLSHVNTPKDFSLQEKAFTDETE